MNYPSLLKTLPALAIALLTATQAYAQITINNSLYTTTQLVDGVLVPAGSGTTVTNVSYQGVYNVSGKYQAGYFSTAGTTRSQMGFSSGVVLSTGSTADIPLTLGADPQAAQMSTGYTSTCANGEIRQTGTCPVLINDVDVLAGAYNYFNASILEFDFVPVTDFVKFRYIFGSEEYEDNSGLINYQCSAYNDKFGFLISGPGIAGGQGYTNNARNIARLANGAEVSINAVNNGVVGSSGGAPAAAKCLAANSSWLQNVSTAEYLGQIDGTQLNGNTRILTAQQGGLTPGQTYHIKLIVTDVSDAAYDAVVYLEAGSFITTSTANAGSNQSLCTNSTTLNALLPVSGSWSVVSGTANFANAASATTSVSGLSAGANILKWSNGTDSATVTLTVNTAPVATPGTAPVLNCVNTTASLGVSTNAAGATYNWSGPGIVSGSNTATPTINQGGTYIVTVTNPSTNCSASTSVSVSSNTAPADVSIAAPAALTCTTTSITLTASSNTNNAAYNWGNNNTNAALTVSAAGTYTVTVTNPASGCTATASANVNNNTAPANVSIAAPATLTCTATSVTVTASSNTINAAYNWSNGTTASTLSVSAPGNYTVTVTNPASGCTATASVTVSSNTAPANVSIATPATLTCSNNSVTLTASSNTINAAYNWSNGTTASTLSVSAPGNYTVTVTNPASGCTATASATVNSNADAADVAIATPPTLTCATTSVTLSASSNTINATYNWGNSNTNATLSVSAAGTYTVTVTNPASGCTATASVTVNSNTTAADVTIATPATITCTTTSVTLTASSNTINAAYNWGNSNTNAASSVSAAGTYTVTVTNPASGCTASASAAVGSNTAIPTVSIGVPNPLTCTISSVTLTVGSNTGNLIYNWGNGTSASTLSVSAPGNYSVTVTNPANGCSATATAQVILAGSGVSFTHTDVNATCGNSNGAITISTTAGTGPFTYLWSDSATTAALNNLTAGNYAVTVTDSLGCSATAAITLTTTPAAQVSITGDTTKLCASDSAYICATPGFVSYLWNNGLTDACLYTRQAGNYYVTVTDANNCTAESNRLAISVYPLPPVSISVNGDTLTTYNANAYQWYLNSSIIPGATSPRYIATQTGMYTVVVSDTNGCRATSNAIDIVITGIDFITSAGAAQVFPNPANTNDAWAITLPESPQPTICNLYNTQGQLVYSQTITSRFTELNPEIASGVYLLHIGTGNKKQLFRLIKL